ncbi:MAG TPA: STAS domain-containing protein [Dehalococcoidia bacterium]
MKYIDTGNWVSIINLDNEVTSTHEGRLLNLSKNLVDNRRKALILDFSSVSLLDNTGINALVKLHAYTRTKGTRLLATGLSDTYKDVFAITGIDKGFSVCNSVSKVYIAAGINDKTTAKNVRDKLSLNSRTKALDADFWVGPIRKLKTDSTMGNPVDLNVNGRYTAGPIQGFGQLWEKTYRLDLSDTKLRPIKIINILKSNFPKFQPPENRFFPSSGGIKPGEIVLINADTPGGLVATGVLVLYASKDTFTFITPQGHPEAGWVNFKSFEESGHVIIQIQGLARASDPIYEIAFRVAGSNLQRQIWTHVLESLAKYTGSSAQVQFKAQCIDSSLQWSRFFNVFQNAQISSIMYSISHPSTNSKQPRKSGNNIG